MDDDVDDRYAGIDIDSLLNRNDTRRGLTYGRKKALYEAPEFLKRLNGEETIMEGQALCLECKVQGFPVPTLRWYKDDEEIIDHPRIKVQSDGKGGYALTIDNVMRGDEAAYRCRAENVEGACSSVFFLSVRAKPKSSRKDNQKSSNRRTVSFPPMFSTIVEKVEEEEKQGKEFEMLPPSPLTDSYYALTLKSRATWPAFLGDWAFKNGNRRGSDDDIIPNGDVQGLQSPSEGRENARKSLRRSDLTARVQAKKQRLDEEKKQREEEAAKKKKNEEETEADKRKREEEEREKEEAKRKLEEKREEGRKQETKLILEKEERRRKRAELERESAEKEEAMRKRREARAERIERERREREEEDEKWRKQQEEEDNQRRLRAQKRQAEEDLERAEVERLKEEAVEKEKQQKEEARRKEQEEKRKEEEKKKKEEEERKKYLEEKRKEEEKKKREEEERKRLLEEKKKAEEKKKMEEDAKKKQLEEKRKVEEKKRKEEEEKRKHLEEKRKDEERKKKQKEEEERKRLEELKRKEEEEKKKKEEEEKRTRLRPPSKRKENGIDEKLQSLFVKNKNLNEDNKKSLPDKKDQKTDPNTNNAKSKPKAFQMFEQNTEEKSGQASQNKPKPGVLGRFQEKLESQPASSVTNSEETPGKPGKLKLPGSSVHDKMASLQNKTDRDRSPGEGSNSTKNIPDKPVLKKQSPWHKKDEEDLGTEAKTNEAKLPPWKKDINSKKTEEKRIEDSKLKDNSLKREKAAFEDERKKLEEKNKAEAKLKEEAKKKEEEKLKEEKRKMEEKKRIDAKLEETKRKEQEKLLLEKKKEEEKRVREAKQKEETRRKEEEKRKADEKKRAEDKLREDKKKLEEKQKQLELKQKLEAQEKKKKEGKEKEQKEEKEKLKKEELMKADLVRKQAAQREALEKKKEEEEAKKKAQKEKEEQEKMRLQFRKEQLRKEQLKRQRDEEIQRKQKKNKEDEKKREKVPEIKEMSSPEEDDDAQVKVYKRDYSFSDLRKSLEATLTRGGAPVIDAEEHKYWDDILEKHHYSIGDIKKNLDTLSSGSATLERPARLRSRRNSIEDLEIVKMKRSSSISDLRESFTKSLERPKSKKKACDPDKVKRDEEILKRTVKLTETRQQLLETVKKQLEPLTGGQSTREADITIRNLKTKTAETPTARSPVGGMPASSPFLPQAPGSNPTAALGLNNLSISVKSKRASFHEMISQKPGADATPSLRIASFSGKDVSKRKSYHGHDAYGSREIPVYRRAAGWADEIGKSRDASPQPPSLSNSSVGGKGTIPTSSAPFSSSSSSSSFLSVTAATSEGKVSTPSNRPGKLSLPEKLGSEVRPFVFNSTRTIARRSTGSLSSDFSSEDDDDSVFDDDDDDEDEHVDDSNSDDTSLSRDPLCPMKKPPLFYFDEDGDITIGDSTEQAQDTHPSDLTNEMKSKGDNLARTSSGYNTAEEDREEKAKRLKIPRRVEEKGGKSEALSVQCGVYNEEIETAGETFTPSISANGGITPPIVVEVWGSTKPNYPPYDESQEQRERDKQHEEFLREEREPTPFMPGPPGKPKLSPANTGSSLASPENQPPIRFEREATPTPELGRKKYNLSLNVDSKEQTFHRESTPFLADSDPRKKDHRKPDARHQLTLDVPKHNMISRSQLPGHDSKASLSGNANINSKKDLVEFSCPQSLTDRKIPASTLVTVETSLPSLVTKTSQSNEKDKTLFTSKGSPSSGCSDPTLTVNKNIDTISQSHHTPISTLPKDGNTSLSSLPHLQSTVSCNINSPNTIPQHNQKSNRIGTQDKNVSIPAGLERKAQANDLDFSNKQTVLMQNNSSNMTNQDLATNVKETKTSPGAYNASPSIDTGGAFGPPQTVDNLSTSTSQQPRSLNEVSVRDLPVFSTTSNGNKEATKITQISNSRPKSLIPVNTSGGSDRILCHNKALTTDTPYTRLNMDTSNTPVTTPGKPPVITSRPPLDTYYQRPIPEQQQKPSRSLTVGESKSDQIYPNTKHADPGESSASDSGHSRSARSSSARDSTPALEADVNVKVPRRKQNGDSQAATSTDNETGSRVRVGLSQGFDMFMSVIEWIVLPPLPQPDSTSAPHSVTSEDPYGDQSSSSEAGVCYDTSDATSRREDATTKSRKKPKLKAPRLSRRRASRTKQLAGGNRLKVGANDSHLTLSERVLRCSPFGRYTSLAVLFITVMTFVCLTFNVPAGKFVCYVLACFYAFCVLRNIGVLD